MDKNASTSPQTVLNVEAQTAERQSPVGREKWVMIGCLSAAIAVALGAIGAHALEGWLETNYEDSTKRLASWETASRYQMYHSIGLMVLGLTTTIRSGLRNIIGIVMLLGLVMFCGCLYGYVITDIKPLVHVVPIGGICFILAWILFGCGFFIRDRSGD